MTLATIVQAPHLAFDRILEVARSPEIATLDPGFADWLEARRPQITRVIQDTAGRLEREARAHWRQLAIAVEEVLKKGHTYVPPQSAIDMNRAMSGEYQAPGANPVQPITEAPGPIMEIVHDVGADPQLPKSTKAYMEAVPARMARFLGLLTAAYYRNQHPQVVYFTTAPHTNAETPSAVTLERFALSDPVTGNAENWRKVAIYDGEGSPTYKLWYTDLGARVQTDDPRVEHARREHLLVQATRDRAYRDQLAAALRGITSEAELDRRLHSGEFDMLGRAAGEDVRQRIRRDFEAARREKAAREDLAAVLAAGFRDGDTVIEYQLSKMGNDWHRYGVERVFVNLRLPAPGGAYATGASVEKKPRQVDIPLHELHDLRRGRFERYTGSIPPAVIARSPGPEYVQPSASTSAGVLYWVPTSQYSSANRTLVDAAGKTVGMNRKAYDEARLGGIEGGWTLGPDGRPWKVTGHAAFAKGFEPPGWPNTTDHVRIGEEITTILAQLLATPAVARVTASDEHGRNTSGVRYVVWRADNGQKLLFDERLARGLAGLKVFANLPLGAYTSEYALVPVLGFKDGQPVAIVMPLRQD